MFLSQESDTTRTEQENMGKRKLVSGGIINKKGRKLERNLMSWWSKHLIRGEKDQTRDDI